MGAIKRMTASNGVRRVLCALGALYIRLVHLTGRWTVVRGELPDRLWDSGEPFILCFWHGRLLMMPYCWRRDRPIRMLISQHRDGQIIARTVSHFGIDTVTGSSSKGGAQALRAMLATLKEGRYVGITPDGPRGPRMRASDGIVTVARLAGVPVVPVAFGATRRRVLSTWDRFVVPLPFARGVFVWGEPIMVARDDAAETVRRRIEDALNAVTREADAMTDQAAIEPAEAPLPATGDDATSAGAAP